MNAMDLQLSVFQKTGTGTGSVRPVNGTGSVQRPVTGTGPAPSFSAVLAALTQKNETPRTAPSSSRLRALESSVAANRAQADAIAASHEVRTAGNASATGQAGAARNNGQAAPTDAAEISDNNGLDISTKEARKILRDALNSDDIPTELLTLLTDDNGDISDSLLDLILADDDEDATEDLGLGTGDVSDQLTSVLTDARQAQELLSTQSGRELINAMSERSIASLVTG